MFTSVQQAVTLSYKGLYFSQGQKTINIYTGSKYAFGLMILECCNAASFLPMEIKFKISLYILIINAILLYFKCN